MLNRTGRATQRRSLDVDPRLDRARSSRTTVPTVKTRWKGMP